MKWTLKELKECYEAVIRSGSAKNISFSMELYKTLLVREIDRREKAGRKAGGIDAKESNRQRQQDYRERQKIRLKADDAINQIIQEAKPKLKKKKSYRGHKKHLTKKRQGKPTVKEKQSILRSLESTVVKK